MTLSHCLSWVRCWVLATLALSGGLAVAQTLPDQSHDQTLGVVNCASSLCHGSIAGWDGSPVVQNEYVIWSRLDKHARAHALLTNAQSRSIAAKLGLPKPAHLSRECVDCHAHNPSPASPRPASAHSVADGISCEGCHGPAQRWIASHTAPGATHQSNIRDGLYPVDQPLARAKLCLSCHFGSSEKYVSHRIMAAGHPRMSFEMDTFTNLQPAHFKVDADYIRRKGNIDGVRIWAIGQAVAVATQIDILLDPQRGRDGAFPELTLFDCNACHHRMADTRWQPHTAFGKSISPGLVRLNASGMLMLRLILAQIDPPLGARFNSAVRDLNAAMAGKGDMRARALDVKTLSDEAARMIAARGLSREQLRGMALALVDDGLAGAYPDYADAEQAAMALGSVVNTLHKLGQLKSAPELNKGLTSIREVLRDDEAYQPAQFQDRLRGFRPLVATPLANR
ncbi:MAG: multiheme c-type cytochrome [Burkholderiaceae bacterium]